MTKLFSMLCTTLFVVMGNSMSLVAEESINTTSIPVTVTHFAGRVTGNKVRLRTQPNLEGHVVRETSYGELLGITGEEQGFYMVKAPSNTKGYVFRTFVLDNVIEGENVNIRLHPDADAPVIGKLHRGDKIQSVISDSNNKWLEIATPESVHFYIAKEYVEQCGPIEMVAQMEKRRNEATYYLSSAFHFAQSELQKSFREIDLDSISGKFTQIAKEYSDLPDVVGRAGELASIMQDSYLQKKIAFLESKNEIADHAQVAFNEPALEKFKEMGLTNPAKVALAASEVMGLTEAKALMSATDKMSIWQPLEESIYHLWMAVHGEQSMQKFYSEEELNANILTGTVESYTKPVKNRPGDFILKDKNLPIAFLYSTRVDLEKMVGQKITVKVAPRPNNNFAFPAYFVLSVE